MTLSLIRQALLSTVVNSQIANIAESSLVIVYSNVQTGLHGNDENFTTSIGTGNVGVDTTTIDLLTPQQISTIWLFPKIEPGENWNADVLLSPGNLQTGGVLCVTDLKADGIFECSEPDPYRYIHITLTTPPTVYQDFWEVLVFGGVNAYEIGQHAIATLDEDCGHSGNQELAAVLGHNCNPVRTSNWDAYDVLDCTDIYNNIGNNPSFTIYLPSAHTITEIKIFSMDSQNLELRLTDKEYLEHPVTPLTTVASEIATAPCNVVNVIKVNIMAIPDINLTTQQNQLHICKVAIFSDQPSPPVQFFYVDYTVLESTMPSDSITYPVDGILQTFSLPLVPSHTQSETKCDIVEFQWDILNSAGNSIVQGDPYLLDVPNNKLNIQTTDITLIGTQLIIIQVGACNQGGSTFDPCTYGRLDVNVAFLSNCDSTEIIANSLENLTIPYPQLTTTFGIPSVNLSPSATCGDMSYTLTPADPSIFTSYACTSQACADTDAGATDTRAYSCSGYMQSDCGGSFDVQDQFSSSDMCCMCSGGESATCTVDFAYDESIYGLHQFDLEVALISFPLIPHMVETFYIQIACPDSITSATTVTLIDSLLTYDLCSDQLVQLILPEIHTTPPSCFNVINFIVLDASGNTPTYASVNMSEGTLDIEITDASFGDSTEELTITAVIDDLSNSEISEATNTLSIEILACSEKVNEEYQGTNEEERPYFENELEEQFVLVGDSWSYTLPEAIHPLSLDVSKEVTLGVASLFTNYNEATESFFINSEETSESLIGTYQIQVRLKDSNETYSELTYTLSLTLVSNQESLEETTPNDETVETIEIISLEEVDVGFLFDFTFEWISTQTYYQVQQALSVSIQSISPTGLLTIKFTNEMLIPPYLQPDDAEVQSFPIEEIVALFVVSSHHDFDSDLISIADFKLIKFQDKILEIQIDFANPNYISMDLQDKDQLILKFKKLRFFTDVTGQQLNQEEALYTELNRQVSVEQEQELIDLEETVETTLQIFSWTTLAYNCVMSFGMKHVWNMVNILQFSVFMSEWQLSYPNNSASFLKYIKMIALMEFLPKDEVIDFLTDTDCQTCNTNIIRKRNLESSETLLSEQEGTVESDSLVRNLGIMLVIALILAVFMLLLLLMRCLVRRFNRIEELYKKICDKVLYNMFIRYILSSTLKIQIATCSTLSLCRWASFAEVSQGIVAIIILVAFVACPILFASVMYANFENLDKEVIRRKIGTMYNGVFLEDNHWHGLTISIVFLVRRTIFLVITFSFYDYPALQIQLFIWTSVLYITYLGQIRIYHERSTLRLEYLNETIFLVICYHLILFTNIVDIPSTVSIFGASLIVSILVLSATNILFMFIASFKAIYNMILTRWSKNLKQVSTKEDTMQKKLPQEESSQMRNRKELRQLFTAEECKQEDIQVKIEITADQSIPRKVEVEEEKSLSEDLKQIDDLFGSKEESKEMASEQNDQSDKISWEEYGQQVLEVIDSNHSLSKPSRSNSFKIDSFRQNVILTPGIVSTNLRDSQVEILDHEFSKPPQSKLKRQKFNQQKAFKSVLPKHNPPQKQGISHQRIHFNQRREDIVPKIKDLDTRHSNQLRRMQDIITQQKQMPLKDADHDKDVAETMKQLTKGKKFVTAHDFGKFFDQKNGYGRVKAKQSKSPPKKSKKLLKN